MRHLLTDGKVRTAIPGEKEGKPDEKNDVLKLSDGDGLQLWVKRKNHRGRPSYVRIWNFDYRFAGKRKGLWLGRYPTVSLAFAREKAEEARQLLAKGIDPSAHRKAAKTALENTFNVVADEWLAGQVGQCSPSTYAKSDWVLKLVRPHLGSMPIDKVTPQDCINALKRVAGLGRHGKPRYETTRRTKESMSRVFKLAVATGRCQTDPTASLSKDAVPALGLLEHKSYAAITDPTVFGGLLRAIDGYDGSATVRHALEMLSLTALRPGELRQLRWMWIDGEVVTLPADVMKSRREHRVYLSKRAVAIIAEMRELTGWCEFVFPSNRSPKAPMSEGTLGAALKRLGYESSHHVPHGFRSSFSTMANESGPWRSDIVEAALAHGDEDRIRATYNRAGYEPERRKLAQWWADCCDEMRVERSAKVVALRSAQA
jgi:integrase